MQCISFFSFLNISYSYKLYWLVFDHARYRLHIYNTYIYDDRRRNLAYFWLKDPQYLANYITISTIYNNSFAL